MNSRKHIINRQILELTLPTRDNALALQRDVNEIVKTRLAASLDELFCGLMGEHEVLRIDKLEIDLGRIHACTLKDELVSKTVEKIEDQLLRLICELKDQPPHATHNQTAKENGPKSRLISRHNSCLDQLVYFLKNGFLPWWNQSKEEFPLSGLLEKVLVEGHDYIADQIGPLLENEKVRKRLIFQFDHELVIKLLKSINPDYVSHLNKLFQILKAIQNANTSKLVSEKQLDGIYWDLAISWIVGKAPVYSEVQEIEFLQRLLEKLVNAQSNTSPSRSIVDHYHAITSLSMKIETPVYEHLLLAVKSLASKYQLNLGQFRHADLKEDGEVDILARDQYNQQDDIQIAEANDEELFIDVPERKEQDIIKDTDGRGYDSTISDFLDRPKSLSLDRSNYFDNTELDDILIHNAGLVILHPFLKYFFTGLNLLEKDQFINREAAHHAVHLLQYLVTKELKYPEYELVLNKILCGLKISDPIPPEMEISNWEIEECDNLLKAVLEQWKVLKARSTEALRETFLKREGILSNCSGCTLKVERNTFDVLLDRLPWGLSLIKLPWNPQIIYVEW